MKIDEFKQQPWRVHSFLACVPLHTLERVELHGGHAGMTLAEISAIVVFGGEVEIEVDPVTRALFWLRGRGGQQRGAGGHEQTTA